MGARKPGPSFDMLAALEDPRARLQLICLRCERQRRAEIIKAVAWLRRQGVRRLHWLEAATVETFAAADSCPDCGCTSWEASLILLPPHRDGPIPPRYAPG